MNNGISTKLREHSVLKHMSDIYRIICHRLELACAYCSGQLRFSKDSEGTFIQFWEFLRIR